jgi:hypothetical protein
MEKNKQIPGQKIILSNKHRIFKTLGRYFPPWWVMNSIASNTYLTLKRVLILIWI